MASGIAIRSFGEVVRPHKDIFGTNVIFDRWWEMNS